MSRLSSATCPLSDCTLAVDNAENIRNSKDVSLLALKVAATAVAIPSTPRQRALLRNAKAIGCSAAAEAVTLPACRERVSGTTHSTNITASTAVVNTAAEMPPFSTNAVYRSSSLDCYLFAKPFTPASTLHRNDPYSPCLLKSTCSPEDSFYACYSEVDEALAVVAMNPANTPTRLPVVCQTAALPSETQALLELLSKTTVSSSLCMSPITAPMKMCDSAEQSPASLAAGGGLTTTPSLASTPERAASPSSRQLCAASARVIRKVVSCGVDRTSGRPVPKPKE
ncbi:hypothetical protein LPMP_202450 [Leishmania panamensis]|uniref:Uncharacterized protein n=1 Tax=Leishmania panamensis TaxID=5679 RepID=A0A088S839_LEIPA|nr:hypothetical protein LPMP_202450 [Leishmania panamensis]AIN97741.1 hypothetical protein LPMP_202450 [Leishmania panamensis]